MGLPKRLRILPLTLLLVAALTLRADSQQGGSISQMQERIEELQRQLADAEARARDLGRDETRQQELLRELGTQITTVQELLLQYGRDIERLNGRAKELEGEIQRLDTEIEVLQEAVRGYVVTLYKRGRRRLLETVLSAESFTEGVRRLKGVTVMAARQRDDVDRLARSRREKDDAHAEVSNNRAAAQQRQQASQGRRRGLQATQTKTEQLLARISQDQRALQQTREQTQQELDEWIQRVAEEQRRLRDLGLHGDVPLGGFAERRGNLVWPLGGVRGTGRIVRGFGRQSGVDNTTVTSRGIDILAPDDRTPVVAVHNGLVLQVQWIPLLGNIVFLDHGDGFLTVYANVDGVAVLRGDPVPGSFPMGVVGTSLPPAGDEPAGHLLRFFVYEDGGATDPMTWLGGGG